MRSFLEWFDDKGFWVQEYWDFEAGEMKVGGGKMELTEEQRRVLGHCLTPDESGQFAYTTILYSAPKKCLAPDTRVLTFDLHWVKAGDLKAGDELLAFDKDPQHKTGKGIGGTGRYYRKSVVMHTGRAHLPARRLTLANGQTFVASTDHRWLVKVKGGKNLKIAYTRDLKVGHTLMKLMEPWDDTPGWEDGYMAGVFDGEGSVRKNGREMGFGQKDNILLETAKNILTKHGIPWLEHIQHTPYKGGICDVHKVAISGRGWLLHALGRYRPVRLRKRLELDGGIGTIYAQEHVVITEIEELQSAEVVTLGTSTETYIAEGYASLNSGKTAIAAAIGAWVADEFPSGTQVYVIANDKDQAEQRVFSDITYNMLHNRPDAVALSDRIDFPNDTLIMALAKEHKSGSGSRHTVTIWDELWGYVSENSRRMWVEMTPIPTARNSLRIVVTYAGYENESELLWDLYERGVGPEETPNGRGEDIPGLEDLPCWKSGRLFTYWTHEHTMPWQTQEYYDEESEDLRASDMLRLHYNRWVSGHEEFLPPEWWDKAASAFPQSAELWSQHPYRRFPVYVGVDVAPKHDCSAVVGVTYDARLGKVIILFAAIWDPQGKPLDIELTVEAYLRDHQKRFAIRSVDYDPYQLHRSMVSLKNKGLPTREFPQTSDNMTAASQTLWTLMRNGHLLAYPDPDCRQHIKNSVAQSTPRGFRIIKDPATKKASGKGKNPPSGRRPIDFTIALAMACHAATELGAVDTAQTIVIPAAFSDQTAWGNGHNPAEVDLPWIFRS